jgi:hypothetical protein
MKAFACWAGGGADCAAEAGLPVSFCFEVGEQGKAECDAKIDARLCGAREDSADPGDRGCGCSVADVRGRLLAAGF